MGIDYINVVTVGFQEGFHDLLPFGAGKVTCLGPEYPKAGGFSGNYFHESLHPTNSRRSSHSSLEFDYVDGVLIPADSVHVFDHPFCSGLAFMYKVCSDISLDQGTFHVPLNSTVNKHYRNLGSLCFL